VARCESANGFPSRHRALDLCVEPGILVRPFEHGRPAVLSNRRDQQENGEQIEMTKQKTYFGKSILMATCLTLGCTSSGALGCGSSVESSSVDTELLGIYQVSSYQRSENGCDQITDASGGPRLALYTIPSNETPDQALLVGQFCGSVDDCRARVRDRPTIVNYSFFQGSDLGGWVGWAVPTEGGMVGDQCRVEVQTHTLTSPSDQAVRIDTRQVETVFMGMVEGNEATCSIREAIASINDDSPCTALFLLEASFEARL